MEAHPYAAFNQELASGTLLVDNIPEPIEHVIQTNCEHVLAIDGRAGMSHKGHYGVRMEKVVPISAEENLDVEMTLGLHVVAFDDIQKRLAVMCPDIQTCEVILAYAAIGLIAGRKLWTLNVLNDALRHVKLDPGEVHVEYSSKEVDV